MKGYIVINGRFNKLEKRIDNLTKRVKERDEQLTNVILDLQSRIEKLEELRKRGKQ